MNSEKGSVILLMIISVATLLVAVAGATFAYFGIKVGNESEKIIEATSGTLSVEYDTNSKINAANLNPGDIVATKTFTVTGVITGSEHLNYEATLHVKNNTYTDGALVYTLTSKNVGNNGQTFKATTKPVAIKSGASTIDLSVTPAKFAGPTPTGSTHEYTLTITYVNTGEDQSINAGKIFSGQLQVKQTTK